jgi:putative hemolysin
MKNGQTAWNWKNHSGSRLLYLVALATMLVLLVACTATDTPETGMPNPAAVYCEEQGYAYEIRTAADGSQSGVCIFDDGSECDGWAFYRGECKPGAIAGDAPTPTVSAAAP